jgi:hypothetical protein
MPIDEQVERILRAHQKPEHGAKGETFADLLYHSTFRRLNKKYEHLAQIQDNLRKWLFCAKRFVLDDGMAAFIADLTIQTFSSAKHRDHRNFCTRANRRLIEQIRLGSRLPHQDTWVEYDAHIAQKRTEELVPEIKNREYVGTKEGWLLQKYGESYFCSMFIGWEDIWYVLPWAFAWSADDNAPANYNFQHGLTYANTVKKNILPFFRDSRHQMTTSEIATGLIGYKTNKVDIVPCSYLELSWPEDTPDIGQQLAEQISQISGRLRRVWAVLATINDVPVLTKEVRAAKGFIARGSYKRFLDHQTITLHVPKAKDMRVLARHVVALSRKRAHMVRAHWRKDWRRPPHPLCDHEFKADGECKHCFGHRLWIHEHERGDKTLGVILTDYEVVHD